MPELRGDAVLLAQHVDGGTCSHGASSTPKEPEEFLAPEEWVQGTDGALYVAVPVEVPPSALSAQGGVVTLQMGPADDPAALAQRFCSAHELAPGARPNPNPKSWPRGRPASHLPLFIHHVFTQQCT